MNDRDKSVEGWFLQPSKEEQAFLILQGKCPHNAAWYEDGHSHNSTAYKCSLCREIKFW